MTSSVLFVRSGIVCFFLHKLYSIDMNSVIKWFLNLCFLFSNLLGLSSSEFPLPSHISEAVDSRSRRISLYRAGVISQLLLTCYVFPISYLKASHCSGHSGIVYCSQRVITLLFIPVSPYYIWTVFFSSISNVFCCVFFCFCFFL